nr:hypothetical protein [uncultured Rhodopila sp.]
MADDFSERLIAKTLDDRSASYRWLWKRRVEIEAVFAQHGRRWNALARTAADEGLAFNPDDLRKSWGRLQIDLARAGVTDDRKSEPSRPIPGAPTSQLPPRPPEPPAALAANLPDNEEEITITSMDGKTTRTVRIPKAR